MSESDPETPPEGTAPEGGEEEGFLERAAGHLLPHLEHAEAEAGHISAEVRAELQEHAVTVFGVAGEVLSVLKAVDPADAALFAAAGALVPKVYAMVEKAAVLAQGALKSA